MTALSITRTGVGLDLGAINALYPVGYLLLSVSLLAADARYVSEYGRRGRLLAVLLSLSLLSYAGSIIVLLVSRIGFGSVQTPVTGLIGIAFLAMRLLGSLYGVRLWRRTETRLTAGLFIAVLPAALLLGPLAVVGFPAFWIESPLYLAFIALGYDLWRGN
ncbi:hypothetical protein GCM10009000_013330 [Halobacterium noricense]